MGYSKLFSEIVTSSIWSEDDSTRIVWITMLALKDSRGFVPAAIPGLANAARVSVEQCEAAVAKLESPDKYSRTEDHDGRRIKKVDGGWLVLNHEKYRDKRSDEERREYQRRWQAKHRQKHNVDNVDTMLTNVDTNCQQKSTVDSVDTMLTNTSADTDIRGGGGGGEPTPPPVLSNVAKNIIERSTERKTGVSVLADRVQSCRPEFRKIHRMELENVIRSFPIETSRGAVEDFCRDWANNYKTPDNPIKLLRGYISNADVKANPPKIEHRKTVAEVESAKKLNRERQVRACVKRLLADDAAKFDGVEQGIIEEAREIAEFQKLKKGVDNAI